MSASDFVGPSPLTGALAPVMGSLKMRTWNMAFFARDNGLPSVIRRLAGAYPLTISQVAAFLTITGDEALSEAACQASAVCGYTDVKLVLMADRPRTYQEIVQAVRCRYAALN